jgi:histidinol-phosphate aminotransferase
VTLVAEAARRRVASLPSYSPGKSAVTNAGKLSSNESPLGPPPGVAEAVAGAMRDVNRYPDARSLIEKIADVQGLDPRQLIVTNGSDELCYLLATVFIGPGDRVVVSDPSYQIDELVSQLQGGELVSVPVTADGCHDLDTMVTEAKSAAVVWLPTPHNPTGVALDPNRIEWFVNEVPGSCLVVLDEAYRAYVDAGKRPDVNSMIERHPNVVVQRTFSKEYGLAGLRVGYGIGAADLVDALNRIRPPFNVNAAAIAAAQAALDASEWRDSTVAQIVQERQRLEQTLAEVGMSFFASQANFVTFRPENPARLQGALLEAGLMVRDGSDLGIPGWLRASVGDAAAMAQLRSVLRAVQ